MIRTAGGLTKLFMRLNILNTGISSVPLHNEIQFENGRNKS
jgi:hypothetical protein